MLGLGRNRVIKVPVDGQGRMRAEALGPITGPTIVCTQAGNINTDIRKDGVCWCGETIWQERTAMRISVSSWATTDGDIELSLESMLRVAGKHCSSNRA